MYANLLIYRVREVRRMEKVRNEKYSSPSCPPLWGRSFLIIRVQSFLPAQCLCFIELKPVRAFNYKPRLTYLSCYKKILAFKTNISTQRNSENGEDKVLCHGLWYRDIELWHNIVIPKIWAHTHPFADRLSHILRLNTRPLKCRLFFLSL